MYFVGYEPGHPVKMFSKFADVESFISSCKKKHGGQKYLKLKILQHITGFFIK